MDFACLISTLVGGILSLAGTAIANLSSNKFANRTWAREKRLEFYRDLIQELLTVQINCMVSEEAIEKQKIILDVEALNDKLELLSKYIQNHLADIYIFFPRGTYRELLKLQSEIYTIIENQNLHHIDMANLKASNIYRAVMHAQNIADSLTEKILPKKDK